MLMSLKQKKILIVGGAGFVGSNLSTYLLEHRNPAELWIVDNLQSSEIHNVPDEQEVRFLFGSITDNKILQAIPEDVDVLFHLACYHGNQSSIADPLADHENNLLTSLKLFDRIKDFKKLQKVVYSAAGCAVAEKTFDEASPTSEDAPVSLFHDSPYSISKLVGEMYGNYYFQRYGMPFVKARFQNVYGPGEILGAGHWRGTPQTVWRNVVPTFIWKSVNGDALPLENGGNASRDFIFVKDIARGLVACAEEGKPGEAYNLASGVETTIADLANMINELTGNRTPVELKPPRDWDHSGRRFGCTKKSRSQLEFASTVKIHEGLKRTVEWTIANRALIQSCIDRHSFLIRQYNDRNLS